MLYQDIPRIYTAIAEWGACLVYLYMLKREKMKSAHFFIGVLLMLALQCAFLVATGNVSEVLWIPCMIIAVAIMYVFLMVGGSMKTSWGRILLCQSICVGRVCCFSAVADCIYCTGEMESKFLD